MTMTRLLLAGCAALAFVSPVRAQSMQGMDHSKMPGMTTPPKPAPKKAKPPAKPVTKAPAVPRPARKPTVVSKIKKQNKAPSSPNVAKSGASSPVAAESMQGMDHSSMQDMGGSTGAETPQSTCSPEHAKMGHCTLEAGQESSSGSAATSAEPGGHAMMPGMTMGDTPAGDETVDPDCLPEHAKMGHCTPKTSTGMSMSTAPATGTDLAPGNAPAPAPPSDWYADRIFAASEMARSRHEMMTESGGLNIAFISFNLAEYQARKGSDGFRWDGEAWYGGDINRVTFKYEGEGAFGEGIEEAEVQALYSRAIDPYFNLQAGVRQDLGKGPKRTYATFGFEGLAPYWFEVEGAVFVSNKGDVLGRLEGYYDQRITQRLILQPRAELNFAAQDVPEGGIGSGLSDIELGLRLRYEIVKEFAPYVGVEWAKKTGDTARYARLAGDDPDVINLVAGIRVWF